ncbi:MAG TPA: SIS domain-containing protein, partial [Acidimicrobiales bacterium]|nr:SIS domain-containing protein [Acidimicrobiales bacterium]
MKISPDTMGMLEATAGLPEQVARAAESAQEVTGLPEHDDIENVVVLGMGGSGVAGDVMAAVASPFMAVPVVVSKSYGVPAFVGEGTLVFAVSFSGNTEETLEAVSEAHEDGARIIAVTSGGELSKLANEWSIPLLEVPAEIPQPRAAIGAVSIPPLVVLEKIGLFPGASRWVDLAVDQLVSRRSELMGESSIALKISEKIGRTIPLIYGADALGATAAVRWK